MLPLISRLQEEEEEEEDDDDDEEEEDLFAFNDTGDILLAEPLRLRGKYIYSTFLLSRTIQVEYVYIKPLQM